MRKGLEEDGRDESTMVVLEAFEDGEAGNPKNYSTMMKIFLVFACCLLNIGAGMSSALFGPAQQRIMDTYGVEKGVAELAGTLFLFGYSLGPLIWSPISEAAGRYWAMIPAMILFVVFHLMTGLAGNITTFLVGRFLQGLTGVCSVLLIGCVTGDVFYPKHVQICIGFNLMAIYVSPVLGPIVGSFLIEWGSLAWVSWALMIIGGSFSAVSLFMKETYAPVLLRRKAQRLRKEGMDVVAGIELHPINMEVFMTKYVKRPAYMLIKDRALAFLSFYTAIVYGLLYGLLIAFPIAFGQERGFNFIPTYLPTISISIGILASVVLLISTNNRYICRKDAVGRADPELRLENCCVGAVFLPIGLFLFGWTASYDNVHWAVPCVGGIFMGFGTSIVYICCILYIIDGYKLYAASAFAVNGVLRSLCCTLLASVTRLMINKMTLGGAMSFFGGISVLVAPGPFILLRYGAKWRIEKEKRLGSNW